VHADTLLGETLPRPKPARRVSELSDRAVASWSAPVLWRFRLVPLAKAPEDENPKTWRYLEHRKS